MQESVESFSSTLRGSQTLRVLVVGLLVLVLQVPIAMIGACVAERQERRSRPPTRSPELRPVAVPDRPGSSFPTPSAWNSSPRTARRSRGSRPGTRSPCRNSSGSADPSSPSYGAAASSRYRYTGCNSHWKGSSRGRISRGLALIRWRSPGTGHCSSSASRMPAPSARPRT